MPAATVYRSMTEHSADGSPAWRSGFLSVPSSQYRTARLVTFTQGKSEVQGKFRFAQNGCGCCCGYLLDMECALR